MRNLLFLLPLMALASCSGGDVLKSNRPFEMVCGKAVWSIDPELPEAAVKVPGSYDIIWNLTKVTPDRIVLEQPEVIPGEPGGMIRIDRNTGKLWVGRTAPAEEGPKCSFKAV